MLPGRHLKEDLLDLRILQVQSGGYLAHPTYNRGGEKGVHLREWRKLLDKLRIKNAAHVSWAIQVDVGDFKVGLKGFSESLLAVKKRRHVESRVAVQAPICVLGMSDKILVALRPLLIVAQPRFIEARQFGGAVDQRPLSFE